MAIKVTDNAITEIKRFKIDNNLHEDDIITFSVVGGGCSGFSYKMAFLKGEAVTDRFEKMEFNGVKVAVDKRSLLYMNETTVDYYQGLDKRGFVFENPNIKGKCGCGSSFNI